MESQSETTQTVSALKLPVLKTRDYDLWSMRMEQYLTHTDYALWEVIVNGDAPAIASASTEDSMGSYQDQVYEAQIKSQSSSSSNYQNVAFVSSENTSSTNEAVNTAHEVSTASSQGQASSSSYVDDVIFSFFVNQSNSGHAYHESEEILKEDMKEFELQWQRNCSSSSNFEGMKPTKCQELRHQIEEAVKSGKLAHLVKGIKKGKAKTFDTQLAEAPILMVNRESYTSKRKFTKEPINGIGEITFPLVSGSDNSSDLVIIRVRISGRHVNRVYMDSGSSCEVIYEHVFLKINPSIRSLRVDSKIPLVGTNSPYNLLLGRTAMQKMGIVVSTVHATIKFYTPCGIGNVFSTYELNKVEEGQKKVKETTPEVIKDVLSYVDAEERIVVNDKHPEQTVVIGKQLPTSFRRKLQDLLWFNTDHIKPIKQKKHGLALERNEAACKEVDELTKVGLLQDRGLLLLGQSSTNSASPTQSSAQESRLRSINIKLNPKKFSFGGEEGPFLGHLITKQGIKANPFKVKEITDQSISDVLLAEREKRQVLIYFVSRVLQGTKLNYSELEKLILALVHAARRLRRYFQAHPIKVLTDKPIKQILTRLEKSGRIAKWAIELGEHDIKFKGRNSVKGKILADFL
ncbi:reverse transcriptase domain-containing protein [Tanacetum coccineum]